MQLCLQEVADMVDKVSLAMDLVRTELKCPSARVTVTLTIASAANTAQLQQASQQATNAQAMSLQDQQQADQQQQHGQKQDLQAHQDDQKLVMVELLSDNYQDVMTQTVHEVDSDLTLCRQLLQQCQESFSCLVSFYGENVQAFANDAVFWSDVTTFVNRFTACQKQLRKQMQVTLDNSYYHLDPLSLYVTTRGLQTLICFQNSSIHFGWMRLVLALTSRPLNQSRLHLVVSKQPVLHFVKPTCA